MTNELFVVVRLKVWLLWWAFIIKL